MATIKFPAGQLTTSAAVFEILAAEQSRVKKPFETFIFDCFDRHIRGDFGDIDNEDKERNRAAIDNGARILSVYNTPDGLVDGKDVIWVITEADRRSTIILFPSDY